MKVTSIARNGNGWHIELDFDEAFARNAIGGYSELADDAALAEIVGRWFSMRVDDCAEDIEQAAEFHFEAE